MGALCATLLKFFDGLYPVVIDGDFFDFKNSYFISKDIISFFKISYSKSVILGLLF